MMKTNLNVSFPEEEILLPIQGYEGLYSISNFGRVYSHKSNRYLSPVKRTDGYLHVSLCKDGEVKYMKVHRLVLSAFSPRDDSDCLDCNHINGVKDDNRLENLEWSTRAKNMRHSVDVLGNDHGTNRKAVAQFSIDGIRIGVFRSARDAERETGVHNGNICSCAKGSRKQAGGFIWKYLSDLPQEEELAVA